MFGSSCGEINCNCTNARGDAAGGRKRGKKVKLCALFFFCQTSYFPENCRIYADWMNLLKANLAFPFTVFDIAYTKLPFALFWLLSAHLDLFKKILKQKWNSNYSRSRRRRNRENTLEGVSHEEGLSTDDEETNTELVARQQEIGKSCKCNLLFE